MCCLQHKSRCFLDKLRLDYFGSIEYLCQKWGILGWASMLDSMRKILENFVRKNWQKRTRITWEGKREWWKFREKFSNPEQDQSLEGDIRNSSNFWTVNVRESLSKYKAVWVVTSQLEIEALITKFVDCWVRVSSIVLPSPMLMPNALGTL